MSMMNEDEGPHDWEIKDEEPPERLRKKWEHEEVSGPRMAVCPSCHKETPAGNLTCIFCGADLCLRDEGDQCRPNYLFGKKIKSLGGAELNFESGESCPVHSLLSWIKRLFKKG